MVIHLDQEELELLQRPVNGVGGFQSLLRDLAIRCSGARLDLSEDIIERVRRYANRYGSGGFQSRLEPILRKISR